MLNKDFIILLLLLLLLFISRNTLKCFQFSSIEGQCCKVFICEKYFGHKWFVCFFLKKKKDLLGKLLMEILKE